ncbi:hypothetical protein Patl1_34209 [Pistacia atlantica]|uniref:Uncharacterized protein n=1 Tax=Pistacia atlantica TaxID=434234 RepID=A0ACC0ZSA1_9ROSI|nr:hypothetical protein Patl1_34209 [Pistacia atlantica]
MGRFYARPLLAQAMENCNFVALVDPWLIEYNSGGMDQMVACATTSIRHAAEHHPRMSQIVQALEGNMSLDDLNSGIPPRQSSEYGGSKQEMEGIKWNKSVDVRTSEHCSENWTGRFDCSTLIPFFPVSLHNPELSVDPFSEFFTSSRQFTLRSASLQLAHSMDSNMLGTNLVEEQKSKMSPS